MLEMLSIIAILKFIIQLLLWIIGGIFLLLLAVLLIVLFVPIRYKGEGDYDQELKAEFKVTWLLHFINIYVYKDGEQQMIRGRLALWTIFPRSKKSEEFEEKKVEEAKEEIIQQGSGKATVKKSENTKEKEREKKTEPQKLKKKEDAIIEKTSKSKKKKEKKKKTKGSEEGMSGKERLKEIWGFLRAEENKGMLQHVFTYIGRLIRWICPKKASGWLVLGLEDPATTGYVTALASIVYVKTKGEFQFTPNFQEEIVQGSVKFKGRLYLYQPVYYIIRVVIDKRVRNMLKMLKNQ